MAFYEGDSEYYCDPHFYSKFVSKNINVFNYVLTEKPKNHWSSALQHTRWKDAQWIGVTHADELIYVLGIPIRFPDNFTKSDVEFSKKIIKIWTHFAHKGHPSLIDSGLEWPKSSFKKVRYIELSNSRIAESDFEFSRRCEQFWRPIYENQLKKHRKIVNYNIFLTILITITVFCVSLVLVAIYVFKQFDTRNRFDYDVI